MFLLGMIIESYVPVMAITFLVLSRCHRKYPISFYFEIAAFHSPVRLCARKHRRVHCVRSADLHHRLIPQNPGQQSGIRYLKNLTTNRRRN